MHYQHEQVSAATRMLEKMKKAESILERRIGKIIRSVGGSPLRETLGISSSDGGADFRIFPPDYCKRWLFLARTLSLNPLVDGDQTPLISFPAEPMA
jgi:hypothetical protein